MRLVELRMMLNLQDKMNGIVCRLGGNELNQIIAFDVVVDMVTRTVNQE